MGKKTIDFSYQSHYYNIGLTLRTTAMYQTGNAAAALTAFLVLAQKAGFQADESTVREAFYEASWRGRMDEIAPGIIVDGAHNEDGIQAFLSSVSRDGCEGKRFLVFAVSSDKNAAAMARYVAGSRLFDKVIVTRYEDARAMEPDDLADFFAKETVMTAPGAKEAYSALKSMKTKQDLGYIAGSLYLVGEICRITATESDGEENDQF